VLLTNGRNRHGRVVEPRRLAAWERLTARRRLCAPLPPLPLVDEFGEDPTLILRDRVVALEAEGVQVRLEAAVEASLAVEVEVPIVVEALPTVAAAHTGNVGAHKIRAGRFFLFRLGARAIRFASTAKA